jgi:hypothetical protein
VELQQHAEKHPECKSPRGHCHAMALRLVRKEIMKEWWKASRIAAQSDADAQLRDGGKRAGNRVAVDAHGRIVPGPQDSRAEAA